MGSKYVSSSVIKRLPRYYRFLGYLMEDGMVRISSRELAERMGLSASQIRQDLNNFGGFGQQGYGYNIESLYKEIGKISYLSFVGDCSHEGELDDKYAQISERLAKIAEIRETIANTKTTLECPGCGKECSKEDAFCSKCGHKLS